MKFQGMTRDVRIELVFRSYRDMVTVNISGSKADTYTRKLHDLIADVESLDDITAKLFEAHKIPVSNVSQDMSGYGRSVTVYVETGGMDIPEDMKDIITQHR